MLFTIFPKLAEPGFECSLALFCELLRHQLLKSGAAAISVRNEKQIVVKVACTLFNNGLIRVKDCE